MNRDKIIKTAEKCGGSMIYVWGLTPRVDNLDVFEFTKLILEEYINESVDTGGLRDSRPSNNHEPSGHVEINEVPEGASDIQHRPKGGKGRNKKNEASTEAGSGTLRVGEQ